MQQAKGYNRDHLYYSIGGAEVDAFNFHLTMSLSEQVGFGMPVDGGLTLAVSRVYNSGIYSEKSFQCKLSSCLEPSSTSKTHSYLSMTRRGPMGLGWEFHLGRIAREDTAYCKDFRTCSGTPGTQGQMAYTAPDGSKHILFPGTDGYYYSRDGELLRAKYHVTGAGEQGDQPWWELWLADGRVLEFKHEVSGNTFSEVNKTATCESARPYFVPGRPATDPVGGVYEYDRERLGFYVTRIHGREQVAGAPAAYVDVTYHAAPFDYVISRISDSHEAQAGSSRAVTVSLGQDPSDPSYGHVTQVCYPGVPDGAGGHQAPSCFSMSYERKTLTIRGYKPSYPQGAEAPTWLQPVDLLSQVTTPEGYGLRYEYADSDLAVTEAVPRGANDWGGRLEKIHYPSGKLVRLTWGKLYQQWRKLSYSAQNQGQECSCALKANLDAHFVGLAGKDVFLDGDETNLSSANHQQWSFGITSALAGPPDDPIMDDCNVGQPHFCEVRADYYNSISWMVDPSGNRTQIEYDTSSRDGDYLAGSSAGPQDTAYFGKPVEELYFAGDQSGSRELVKKVVRTWSQIYTDNPQKTNTLCTGVTYAVPMSEKTIYADDSIDGTETVLEKTYEDWVTWDGALYHGRFETTVLSGNVIGDWEKVSHTDYAIDNESSPGALCPAAQQLQDAWLPGVVASTWVGSRPAGGGTLTKSRLTQSAYDTSTGRVQASVARLDPENAPIDGCAATLSAIGEQSGDVVTLMSYDAAGNVTHQGVRFGGESQEAFGTDFTWQYGVQATKKNSDTSLNYYDLIATVDPDTSLVTKEEIFGTQAGDPLAVSKAYTYDALQRPLTEQVGDLAPAHYEYQNESLPDGRQRLKAIRTWRGSGDDLTETIEHYDYAGRVIRKEKLTPDGGRAYQHVRYDDMGRESFVSEWTASATDDPSLAGTTKEYTYQATINGSSVTLDDPFGRVRKVTGPLGEVSETDYFGTNRTVTVHGIATGQASEQPQDAVTTYYTDGLDRLVAVDSAEGADAVYEYDVTGALTKVNLVDALSLSPTVTDRYATANADEQVRSFTYDGLGRQVSATHPENGTQTTLSWNALGQPLETQDALGAAWGQRTRLSYDAAGRPVKVERVADSGPVHTYQPGDSGWSASGWSTANAAGCVGSAAWYIGDSDCRYAQSATQVATLDSPVIGAVPDGAVLTFRVWRQVRQTAEGAPVKDRFRVLARKATADPWPAGATELYAVDSSQISWSRWRQSLALRIPVEELAGASGGPLDLELRFEFDSTDTNPNATVKGIALGPIEVKRPASVVLSEIAYDEDHSDPANPETNRPRGKPTTVKTWDEATGSPAHVRKLRYQERFGLLSSEQIDVDWDRDGSFDSFETAYSYDDQPGGLGLLLRQRLPYPAGSAISRSHPEYGLSYRHGALTGIAVYDAAGATTPWQEVLPDSVSTPGIAYNLAGGVERLRFGNGTENITEVNAAYLPSRIRVEEGGSVLFDTGSYGYDGARNIKQIGSDLYRYDLANRLDWARVDYQKDGTAQSNDLDYVYDRYGNMTDRLVTGSAAPAGLHFTGRSYTATGASWADNRIHDADFLYDRNGNLTQEPNHDGADGHNYFFNPENRLDYVQRYLSGGELEQQASYDSEGNRWLRITSSGGGKALITLRDAGGQVVADYEVKSADTGPELVKEYVRGAGGLLAVNATCGPRPELSFGNPKKAGTEYRFHKYDRIPPSGDYHILIESESGQKKTLTRPSTLADDFGIDESEFFAGNNWVSLETTADCGVTGYSNAVSVSPGGGGGGCLNLADLFLTLQRTGFGDDGSSTQDIGTSTGGGGCPPGTVYFAYYQPTGSTTVYRLVQQPLGVPVFQIPSQPASAGHGRYWFTAADPVTLVEFDQSPAVIDDARNTTQNSQSASSPASRNLRYAHRDHLGSTRLLTDERGLEIGHWKYFPFGMEAESAGSGGQRMKFTGHERDGGVGLDYMLARSFSSNDARFLSVDPVFESIVSALPQTWNRYTYARNAPIMLIDPDGRDISVPDWLQGTVARGLEDSARFSQIYKAVANDKRVNIHFDFGIVPPHADAKTKLTYSFDPKSGRIAHITAIVTIPVGGASDVALVGHELAHILEEITTGRTAADRFKSGDKDVWKAGDNVYETRKAKEETRTIRKQLRAARRAKKKKEREEARDGEDPSRGETRISDRDRSEY